MKTFFLLVMLFTFPWSKNTQPTENVLAQGMYTYTGYLYSEKYGEQNSPCAAQAFYVQIYDSKLIQIVRSMETGQDQEIIYTYVETNSDGYRVYRRDSMYQLWVDANFDIVTVSIFSEYNGHVQNYYFGQVVKGDHLMDYLQKCQQQLYNTPIF